MTNVCVSISSTMYTPPTPPPTHTPTHTLSLSQGWATLLHLWARPLSHDLLRSSRDVALGLHWQHHPPLRAGGRHRAPGRRKQVPPQPAQGKVSCLSFFSFFVTSSVPPCQVKSLKSQSQFHILHYLFPVPDPALEVLYTCIFNAII